MYKLDTVDYIMIPFMFIVVLIACLFLFVGSKSPKYKVGDCFVEYSPEKRLILEDWEEAPQVIALFKIEQVGKQKYKISSKHRIGGTIYSLTYGYPFEILDREDQICIDHSFKRAHQIDCKQGEKLLNK
jgi:hypothetical protein